MPSEDHARKSEVTAEAAFSDYLSRRDQDESVDFESFCREHPELEGSLRALHSRHVEDAAPSGDQVVSATEDKVDLGADRLVRDVPEVEGWKILDPCVVHARIGQGGMGVVYRARHLTLNIDVAVKILLPELAERAPQFVQRFHREAELTAALNHANLVRVYHCDERYGLHYLVMELVEGESVLERVVRRGRRSGGKGLGAGESASIVLEAARGLAEAHRKGIVHRDIKPSNILVASDGRVKVTDLGLGRSPLADVLTAEGVLGGTPAYMPPEQWENLSQVGAPADVWALGATFDFLLRGRSVCAAQSPVDIMRRITSQEFPDIRDEVSSVPEDLARILRRCTARDPAARYADASELVEALAESIRCLGFEESLADPEGVTPTSPLLAVPAPSAALLERLRERVRDGTLPAAREAPAREYDAFISYDPCDEESVLGIAKDLRAAGLEVWVDRWKLLPGDRWQHEMSEALIRSSCCLVFVGPRGLGASREGPVGDLLERPASDPGLRIIPVLLPGSKRGDKSRLPLALTRATWVELDSHPDNTAFQRLVGGIRKEKVSPEPRLAGVCPYRGLEHFAEEHADLYFGRASLVDWLIDELEPKGPTEDCNHFVAILGPSGSGKSSLARAGLMPALKTGQKIEGSESWLYATMRPGADPLVNLALVAAGTGVIESSASATGGFARALWEDPRALHLAVRLALKDTSAARFVLLVDQLEEVFTLCVDEEERRSFLVNLVEASRSVESQTIVIVNLRADFYGKCASCPELVMAISAHQQLVAPMSAEELHDAIESPARLCGLEFESGLVEKLIADAEGEPGGLPLLQHALLELWTRRSKHKLTHAAYKEIGGIAGALEKRADEVYARFDTREAEVCRRIFLRLTQPGEGTEDTRRRVSFEELVSVDFDSALVDRVLACLSEPRARLVSTHGGDEGRRDERYIEVAHEVLIRGWPRLREWIDADREGLEVHRAITRATAEWIAAGRRGEFLFSGVRLVRAAEWAARHAGEMNAPEREFLAASRAARARRKRLSIGAVVTLLVAAVVVVVVLNHQRGIAVQKEIDATASKEEAVESEKKARELLAVLNRVSLRVDLDELSVATERLWPASSAKAADLSTWLVKARELAARRRELEETLGRLRAEKALPYPEEQREKDRRAHLAANGHAQLIERRDAEREALDRLVADGHEPAEVTVLDFGGDSAKKHPTCYFRRTFDVVGPDKVKELRAQLIYDDGIVVYLNGAEVLRRNLPDGDVGFSTWASDCLAKRGVEEGVLLPVDLLIVGANLLAVELHQDSPSCSDVVFDLALSAGLEDGREPSVLLAEGSPWRYHDRGEDLGDVWRGAAFDDSAWREGGAPLGYGFVDGPGKAAEAKRLVERLEAQIAALEAEEPERLSWQFSGSRDRWWYRTFLGLVEDLRRFAGTTIPDIEKRLEFASTVREKTLAGEKAAAKWSEAIARVRASERYGEALRRKIVPQEGLIPLGPDPGSGLEEFAHLPSGKPAARREDGTLDFTEETGLVFVLIPGGAFLMGATKLARLGVDTSEADDGLRVDKVQRLSLAERLGFEAGDVVVEFNGEPVKTPESLRAAMVPLLPDARAPLGAGAPLRVVLRRGGELTTLTGSVEWNLDPHAELVERPTHPVRLDAFLVSKYEMTQAQWSRFTGTNPSLYDPGRRFGDRLLNLRHPVERVSWESCERELQRLGLVLPTEAQWEYAARAGEVTPLWSGTDPEQLATLGNIADQFCKANGGSPSWTYEKWNDGYTVHAPVGSFRANRFGLHDVLGNVAEWCQDWFGLYDKHGVRPGDGHRRVPSPPVRDRVHRGGSWNSRATRARLAGRHHHEPTFRSFGLGLRPAKLIRE